MDAGVRAAHPLQRVERSRISSHASFLRPCRRDHRRWRHCRRSQVSLAPFPDPSEAWPPIWKIPTVDLSHRENLAVGIPLSSCLLYFQRDLANRSFLLDHSQRFYKLKKESEALTNGTATASASTTTAPTTPTNKKSRAAPGTSGRKRKAAANGNNATANGNGNDEDEKDASPTKKTKTKTAVKSKKPAVEAAVADEEGADEDEVMKQDNDDGKSDITVKAEAEAEGNVAGDED